MDRLWKSGTYWKSVRFKVEHSSPNLPFVLSSISTKKSDHFLRIDLHQLTQEYNPASIGGTISPAAPGAGKRDANKAVSRFDDAPP